MGDIAVTLVDLAIRKLARVEEAQDGDWLVSPLLASVVNPLPTAMRIADDCGHGRDPTSRYVHRGRQAV
jgi:hypothetical protein